MYGNDPSGIVFNVWDCAGMKKFQGLREGYWIGADAVLIMFDRTNKQSYENSWKWYNEIRAQCGNDIPIIFLGSKVDNPDLEVKSNKINIHHYTGCKYFDVSAKSCYQFDQPFVELNAILQSS